MVAGSIRLTTAQAIVRFLQAQWSEHDGERRRLVPAMYGIFGHGNVAGLGQALEEHGSELPFLQGRNEQSMVHAAAGFARATRRRQTLACTASIGPGSTNMLTGAAGATINRLPVLLLPSDVYATRHQGPVLQQLEPPFAGDVSVNDAFRPVSRFFDRISRPEQLLTALPEAMRVLTSPAETGAVVLSLPQDVQAHAYAYPAELFEERTWRIERPRPDESRIREALSLLRAARATAPRRRRRRPLLRGRAGAARARAGRRDPDRRDVRRQGLGPGRRLPARARRPRAGGHPGRKPDRRHRRPRPRRRHAAHRLRHRLQLPLRPSGRPLRCDQRHRPRRPQARRAARRRGRARGACGARDGSGRGGNLDDAVLPGGGRPGACRLAERTSGRARASRRRADEPGRADRDPERDGDGRRHGGRRRGGRAGRPAEDLGRDRRPGVPHRVRLLVHGLRDPGRDRRAARPARRRGAGLHR